MSVPVKAILAGAALLGVGGTGIGMLSYETVPEWRPLVKDSEFWSGTSVNSNYQGKYAEKYARLLVGVGTSKDGAKPIDNGKWWDWFFKNRYSTKTDIQLKQIR